MARRGATVERCGRRWEVVTGMCSCCGCDSDSRYMLIVRAGLCDQDGVYFARLCTGRDGGGGCLEDVWSEQARVSEEHRGLASVVGAVCGDDDDWLDGEVIDRA